MTFDGSRLSLFDLLSLKEWNYGFDVVTIYTWLNTSFDTFKKMWMITAVLRRSSIDLKIIFITSLKFGAVIVMPVRSGIVYSTFKYFLTPSTITFRHCKYIKYLWAIYSCFGLEHLLHLCCRILFSIFACLNWIIWSINSW